MDHYIEILSVLKNRRVSHVTKWKMDHYTVCVEESTSHWRECIDRQWNTLLCCLCQRISDVAGWTMDQYAVCIQFWDCFAECDCTDNTDIYLELCHTHTHTHTHNAHTQRIYNRRVWMGEWLLVIGKGKNTRLKLTYRCACVRARVVCVRAWLCVVCH